ncbi:MAG: RNA-directed DNA polymerase [Actinomycetota bacterium]
MPPDLEAPSDRGSSEAELERLGPLVVEPIPKRGGGHRSLVRLGAIDARRYDAAVLAVLPEVERALPPTVFANRAVAGRMRGPALERWLPARARYRRALAVAAASPGRACFIGDVSDCYGSIGPSVVGRALRSMGVEPDRSRRVERLLSSFGARGVRGLPIGPGASAVLANAVLASVDDAVWRAAGARVFRWVDDVVVLTADRRSALAAASAYARSLDAIGLEPNPAKTRVVDDRGSIILATSAASAAHGSMRGMMRAP